MSKASSNMLDIFHCFEKIHTDLCLVNLWIPKEIDFFCLAVILSALVDLQGHTIWQLAVELVMEQLEATCWMDRSWIECLLKNLWHCKRTEERKNKKNDSLFRLNFKSGSYRISILLLFLQLSNPCLLLYTATESLCQVFHGTISINCSQFYSVGWRCFTLITANCWVSNTVWGPPVGNPAGLKVLFFLQWEITCSRLNLCSKLIDFAL